MAQSGDNHNFIAARRELQLSTLSIAEAQRRRLDAIAALDSPEVWEKDGHRTYAQWLSARLGVSNWAAARLINAAHTLPLLPVVDAAFRDARLSLDKVLELCRFATPKTEARLVKWAERVTPASVRLKADVASRTMVEDATDAHRDRWVHSYYFDEGRRYRLEGEFPADEGAVIDKAIDRLADGLPDIVDEDGDSPPREDTIAERRADAVYAMASARIADDHDPDRATVVVHAELTALIGAGGGCELQQGPAIHAETVRRLYCDSRLEVVLHNELGEPLGVGRTSRVVPAWLLRQLRYRDICCTFPGCESKRFLHAHHIEHWLRGGRTDLENLVLVCSFHHKLVHEYGWNVKLGLPGIAHWYRPNGSEYMPNRAPPRLALTG